MNLPIKATDKVIRSLLTTGFVITVCLSTNCAFAQTSQIPKVDSESTSGDQKVQNPIRVSSNSLILPGLETESKVDAPWLVNIEAVESQSNQEVEEKPVIAPAIELQDDSKDELQDDQPTQEDEQLRQRPDFGKWPKRGIRGIKIGIRETNDNVPEDLASQLIRSAKPKWTHFAPEPKVFAWAAPNIRYQPLYFEDVALERYGQTLPPYRQTIKSSVHFFKSVVFLPNKMRHDAPSSCDYPLGFCRPGDATPTIYQRHYFGQPGR